LQGHLPQLVPGSSVAVSEVSGGAGCEGGRMAWVMRGRRGTADGVGVTEWSRERLNNVALSFTGKKTG
jgi:hypothetical protein